MDGLLEICAAAADVAEHAVQNDLHPMRVRLGAERAEILLCAEHGVDPLIVAGVVPVRRPGVEDRVQVQDLHTKLLQVRQLFPDAVQIAAVKIVVQDLAVGIRQVDRYVVLVFVHPVGRDFPGQIAAAALAEAVREDLIHDGSRTAGRDGIFVRQHAQLPEAARLHVRVALSLLKEAERAVLRGDMEVVEVEPGPADGHFPAPGIVKRVVRLLGERHTPQLLPIFGLQDERGRRGPAAARDQDMKRAGLVLLQRAEGRFELRKLAVE